MSRLLLVTPGFHGYWRSIESAIARRGHTVATCVYDRGSHLDRLRYKLLHELPARLGVDTAPAVRRVATTTVMGALDETRPEVVVVVKGDLLEDRFWDALDTRGLPGVTWLYDEVRRTSYTADRLARIGPVASYSAHDTADLNAASIPATHLPLAFDPDLVTVDPRTRNDEVLFVGARYPKRAETLVALAATGVPVRVHGRDWSHHPVDRVRTWNSPRPELPAGRDLARDDAYREMAAAFATLNIHGDQDGFTMRTFEASGVGGVQLLDRTDVAPLYEAGTELLTYTTLAELTEHLERLRADPPWAEQIRTRGRARTLAEHTFDHRVATLESMWTASR